MKKLLLFTLITISLIDVSAQTLENNLRSIINSYSSDSLLNGSILIAKGNTVLLKGASGIKNIEKKEENSLSTLFPIASLTKQFTSAAILLLEENNKLSINDKIGAYIEVPESMKNIQIKHLMNHTSGIPDYLQHGIYMQKDSIYDFLQKQDRLEFNTNTEHRYCNSGYFLLGEIIENVSDKTYGRFLKEKIFIPLGMKNTFVNEGIEFDRALGYDEKWNTNDYLMTTGDGGIISTVDDLYLWDKALLDNNILTAESQQKMFMPTSLENGEPIYYGLGWDINEGNDHIKTHTGWLASFAAYNQFDSEKGYFIILLSNQIRPELMALINEINGVLYHTK